jgi:hypothetical protein
MVIQRQQTSIFFFFFLIILCVVGRIDDETDTCGVRIRTTPQRWRTLNANGKAKAPVAGSGRRRRVQRENGGADNLNQSRREQIYWRHAPLRRVVSYAIAMHVSAEEYSDFVI